MNQLETLEAKVLLSGTSSSVTYDVTASIDLSSGIYNTYVELPASAAGGVLVEMNDQPTNGFAVIEQGNSSNGGADRIKRYQEPF